MRTRAAPALLGSLLPLALAACGSQPEAPQANATGRIPGIDNAFQGQQIIASAHDVPDTVRRLVVAARAKGLTVFATIDHQANAQQAGLVMRPATLVLVGDPKAGTSLMQGAPTAAIDLPLRVLVFQDVDGTTKILTNSIQSLARQHAIVGQEERLGKIDATMAELTRTAAAR